MPLGAWILIQTGDNMMQSPFMTFSVRNSPLAHAAASWLGLRQTTQRHLTRLLFTAFLLHSPSLYLFSTRVFILLYY